MPKEIPKELEIEMNTVMNLYENDMIHLTSMDKYIQSISQCGYDVQAYKMRYFQLMQEKNTSYDTLEDIL
jgi:hypothetical protein